MRRPSLRPQLNQVRLWVRQGRTDAWIAHKLDVSVEQLGQFKREHGLGDERSPAPSELTADLAEDRLVKEIERPERELGPADLDAEALPDETRPDRAAPLPEPDELETPEAEPEAIEREVAPKGDWAAEAELEREPETAPPRRKRRGRRGGRRRSSRGSLTYEATFDHGDEGYGLWLDPAVADEPLYTEHWAGHRAVTVTVEADAITIRRVPGGDQRAPAPDDGL